MKVLLVGGYGVFGARLARMLVRDGHTVTIAGRSLSSAQALADELGCGARQFDREGDLSALAEHEVVVDAAGPFHAYGAEPYRLPRAAIAAGVHYLDLSDNAPFCSGIAKLDAEARDAEVCVLSGLSSVPAISSAAVRALCGTETPRVIDTAILPGNRSPRGLSVMASILEQAGRPMRVWRGGRWIPAIGWSDPADYTLPGGLTRQGWQIEVPDLALFPPHFRAESVIFRAGLELAVMRYGLAGIATLRSLIPIPMTRPILNAIKLMADLLAPLGSGRGGMSVMVIVGRERRWWRLLAEDGDGPFIPAVATRAMLRRKSLPIGARPALEAVSLKEVEAAMADLKVRTERSTEPFIPIFRRVLGQAFETLPDAITATHMTADISRWQGRASVRRGKGVWSRLLGSIFGFPPDGDDMPVEVVKTVTRVGETWQRRFGTRCFRSRLAISPNGMTESFGPFTFLLGLKVQDSRLHYPVLSGKLGPLPLPQWLLPVAEAQEFAVDGVFYFDVRLLAPVTKSLVVHYRGSLVEAERKAPVGPLRQCE